MTHPAVSLPVAGRGVPLPLEPRGASARVSAEPQAGVNPAAPAQRTHGLAYLVSRYPSVSHTFILREVLGLRALGLRVDVASVNPPDRCAAQMTPDERAEAETAYGLKQHGVRGALAALAVATATRPLALLRTVAQAARMGRGFKRVYALAYAVEAAMVVRWMDGRGLHHLHVHFGNEAATVGVLVKTLSGAGLSLTIHGPDEFDDVPGQHLRAKIAAADGVVCISQFGRSQLMRLAPPAHWAKLQLCRLGVDPARFTPPLSERAAGPLRLLCVGRLTPAKGQLLLVHACAELQREGCSFELTLVGDGPDRARLQEAVRRHGLERQIRFAGALNERDVQTELARADAFVLPSLAEGIPVVLMEAMASGVPCISCPVNGIPELIDHGHSGLLATPGDVGDLTTQLRRMIEDAALREALAMQGRAQVEQHFQLGRNVARLALILCGFPAVELRGGL